MNGSSLGKTCAAGQRCPCREYSCAGSVSGSKEDKSGLFPYEMGKGGTPIITSAPLAMKCTVDDVYHTPNFESFICKIDSTHVEEEHWNAAGGIDYQTLKPVLFEFPTYEYFKAGSVIGKCRSFKNEE